MEAVTELTSKLLEQVRPKGMARQGEPSRQRRKSADMRTRILEAAVDCMVEGGYAGLSFNAVIKRAAVSRGAMHHHFATRDALIEALPEYIIYRRMERFLEDYGRLAGKKSDTLSVEIASAAHWRSVQSKEYMAYLQLAVAALTDAEVQRHFLPAARRLDRIWFEEMALAFPRWRDQIGALQAANDIAMAAHMGLLIHAPIFGDEARVDAVREAVPAMIGTLRGGAGERGAAGG